MALPKFLVTNGSVIEVTKLYGNTSDYTAPPPPYVPSFKLMDSISKKINFVDGVKYARKFKSSKKVSEALIAKTRRMVKTTSNKVINTTRCRQVAYHSYSWATTTALVLSMYDIIANLLGPEETNREVTGGYSFLKFIKPELTFSRFKKSEMDMHNVEKLFMVTAVVGSVLNPTTVNTEGELQALVWPYDTAEGNTSSFNCIFRSRGDTYPARAQTIFDEFVERVYTYACANYQVSREYIRNNSVLIWKVKTASPNDFEIIGECKLYPNQYIPFSSTLRSGTISTNKLQFSISPMLWERDVNVELNECIYDTDFLKTYEQGA